MMQMLFKTRHKANSLSRKRERVGVRAMLEREKSPHPDPLPLAGEGTIASALMSIMIVFAILIANTSYAKSPPPGAGGTTPTNVLLMLDVSGSMNASEPSSGVQYPVDLAHDSKNNVYVGRLLDSVQKYDTNGKFLIEIGVNNGGSGNGQFDQVYAVATDTSDNVYVSDYNNGRIQKFSSTGTYIRRMTLQSGPAKGVAVDKNGNIYAVNGSGKVEKFNSSGTRVATWNTSSAEHVATDSSNYVYITTLNTRTIKKYNSSGQLQQTINTTFDPFGIEIAKNGNIYVSDINGDKIHAYTPAGAYIQAWGGTAGISFDSPRGISFDTKTNSKLWIADFQDNEVQDTSGGFKLGTNNNQSRLDQAVAIIKDIVSDSSLTESVNFGLMTWSTNASMAVNVSSNGASQIYNMVDSLHPNGSTNMDKAMTLAQTYLLGPTSPMDVNASCQKTMLIVISDGEWNDGVATSIAGSLYNTYNVLTFIAGFQVENNNNQAMLNYETLSKKGGTYPDSPVYTDNWQQLNGVLRNYIQRAIGTNFTFAAPTAVPDSGGDDFILQSTFQYSPSHQWKGRLAKYPLNDDGTVGSQLWDAGDVLNATAADDRNIWTVSTALPNNINNFTYTNKDRLRVGLEENKGSAFSDTELSNLINFIRGKDTYNEFPTGTDATGTDLMSGERWKLADIYHSRAVVVGPPSAVTSSTSSANSEAYYRYTNNYAGFKQGTLCGVVCKDRPSVIYVGGNDGMLHAFNADSGEELWAFIPPGMLPYFKDMIASNNKSNSIYGVDGTPTVKDIFYNGQWKTVLMGGLRQGGYSYYALDITDASNPKHLFSFAMNKTTNKVSYWDAAGTRTDYSMSGSITSAYNFSALGEAWAQPVIVKTKIGGVYKWVGVVAGGYNGGISASYGSRVYFLDMQDGGKILNTITLTDGSSTNGIVNAVPPRVTAITADDTSAFTDGGALIYVTDLEGKLWKINLMTTGTLYDKTQIFDAEATSNNDRYAFHETTATLNDSSKLVQFFGTGNLQGMDRIASSIANRGYGIIDKDFPNFTAVSSLTASSLRNVTTTCPANSQTGWYVNFNANEKITAKATIKNRTVYFSRFTPDAGDICHAGTAKLTEHDFMCGTTTRTTNLGSGMATEAVIYKNHVYVGISDDSTPTGGLSNGFTKQGNLVVGAAANPEEGKVQVESWWESFQ